MMRCCCFCVCEFSYYVFVDLYVNLICCGLINPYSSVFLSKEKGYGESCSCTDIVDGTYRLHILIRNMTYFLSISTSSDVS